MTDDGHSETTRCDWCKVRAPWRETQDWVIDKDRCFHRRCHEFMQQRGPKTSVPNYFKSDLNYQGDPYHD